MTLAKDMVAEGSSASVSRNVLKDYLRNKRKLLTTTDTDSLDS